MAMEILVPNAAIRNLIREDKVHQIYSMMQTGQAKYGMQTFNQSLATLYFKKQITLQMALARSSNPGRAAGDDLARRRRDLAAGNAGGDRRRGRGRRNASRVNGGDHADIRMEGTRAGQMQTRRARSPIRRKPSIDDRCAGSRSSSPSIKEKGKEIAFPKFGGRVPPQLIAIFTRQFSVMIDAGLPLVQCLEILGSQQENKTFKRALIQIRQDVESGSNLADSMRKHPKIFNDLFTNMVAAGEAGGILDTILQRLAQYIEKSVKLNSQVKSAMIYPVAVISIAVHRRGGHSLEGHPGVRRPLQGPRRRAADADADRHLALELHRRLLVADRRSSSAARSTRCAAITRRTRASASSTASS